MSWYDSKIKFKAARSVNQFINELYLLNDSAIQSPYKPTIRWLKEYICQYYNEHTNAINKMNFSLELFNDIQNIENYCGRKEIDVLSEILHKSLHDADTAHLLYKLLR